MSDTISMTAIVMSERAARAHKNSLSKEACEMISSNNFLSFPDALIPKAMKEFPEKDSVCAIHKYVEAHPELKLQKWEPRRVHYAMDGGAGENLVVRGPDGFIYPKDMKIGKKPDANVNGRTQTERAIKWILEDKGADINTVPVIVMESPVIGSEVDPEWLRDLLGGKEQMK